VWLHIEDNEADAFLVSTVLRDHCPDVRLLRVKDGDEALDVLSSGAGSGEMPVLILMDFRLARFDGLPLIRSIRDLAHHQSTPLIVFSGSRNPDDISACYDAGATCYVFKPLDIEEIVTTLRGIANYWCNVVSAIPTRAITAARS
jgi:CheY-like chemotaxis protein